MIERKIYQCEYCRSKNRPKRLLNSTAMYYHEMHCYYNPKNKTCFTCKHNTRAYELFRGIIGCNLSGTPLAKMGKDYLKDMWMSNVLTNNWKCSEYEYDGEGENE